MKDCAIISIRSQFVKEIFAKEKTVELRKWFPVKFAGKCYIYECGNGSRHAVVGTFETRHILNTNKFSKHEFIEFAHDADVTTTKADYEKALELRPYILIPIIAPVEWQKPMKLDEFMKYYKPESFSGKPPRSSEIIKMPEDICDPEDFQS